ncbi:MAG: hypothetical protein HOP28_10830 [Gemmatimonadales bacterium]|nr:hypothetical protein [Gemmatimonadales bacterium]
MRVSRWVRLSLVALTGVLAACNGDEVVGPTGEVREVRLAPDNVTLLASGQPQTVPFVAAVTADANTGELTYEWITTDPTKATITGDQETGMVTILSNQSGSVGIKLTVSSENGSKASGTAQIMIAGAGITGVTVAPLQLNLSSTDAPVTAIAAVSGIGAFNGHVTWSLASPGIVSIGGTGAANNNVTITPIGAGTTLLRAVADGDPTQSAAIEIRVTAPVPATVQIATVTHTNSAGNEVSVPLTNVLGQIQIHLNVDKGGQTLERIEAVVGGQVVASQSFGITPGPEAAAQLSDVIVLSVNTAQLRKVSGMLIPVLFNGNATLRADLYVKGAAAPLASNSVPIVLTNSDALVQDGAQLRPTLIAPFVQGPGGVTFFRGSQTISGFSYIAFGRSVPVSVSLASTLCGPTGNLVLSTASASTGIGLTGTYECAGVEGANRVSSPIEVAFGGGATGPDGTTLQAPTQFSSVGSAFTLKGEDRWHMLTPSAGALPGPSHIDNKAPVVTIGRVAFNDAFDQPWIGAAYSFTSDLGATDAGSGLGAGFPEARTYAAGVFDPQPAGCLTTKVTSGNDFAETTTSTVTDGKRICAYAEDKLGNSSQTGPSNYFGVDKTPPTARLITNTIPAPVGIAATVNNSIFPIGTPPLAEVFGIEALDGRAGFHQGTAVSNVPIKLSLTRISGAGTGVCTLTAFAPNPFGFVTVLTDNFVRSMEVPIRCGIPGNLGGVGYFFFSGTVIDRAGNVGGPVDRVFAADHQAPPTLAGISTSTTAYVPGETADFFVFASDDVEIIEADIVLNYPVGLAGPFTKLAYSKSIVGGAARFDTVAVSQLAGAKLPVPALIGRLDFICTGVAAPYASCPAADAVATVAADYNDVDTDLDLQRENDDKNPTGATGRVYDVASQVSPSVAIGILPSLINDVAATWPSAEADIVSWKIRTPTTLTTVLVEQKGNTSGALPAFSTVVLGRMDPSGTQLLICQISSAPPASTDNGVFRFWTWNLTKPGSGPCTEPGTGNWFAIGLRNGAGLVTQSAP